MMDDRMRLRDGAGFIVLSLLALASISISACSDDDTDSQESKKADLLPAAPAITNTADEASIALRGTQQTEFASNFWSRIGGVLSSEGASLLGQGERPSFGLLSPLENIQSLGGVTNGANISPELPDGLEMLTMNPTNDLRCRSSKQIIEAFDDFKESLTVLSNLGPTESQIASGGQFQFIKNTPEASEAINFTVKASEAFSAQLGSQIEVNYRAGSDDSTFYFRESSTFNIDMQKFLEAFKDLFSSAGGSDSGGGQAISGLSGTSIGRTGKQIESKPEEKRLVFLEQAESTATVAAQGQSFVGKGEYLRTVEVDGDAEIVKISNVGKYSMNGVDLSVDAKHQISIASENSLLLDLNWTVVKSGTERKFATKLTVTRNESGNCEASFEGELKPSEIKEFLSLN